MFDTYDHIFARRAEAYHDAMTAHPTARTAELLAAVDRCGPLAGRVVGDVPAGGGYLRAVLPIDVGCYVAIEPAHAFLAHCSPGARIARVQARMAHLALRDGALDAVVSLAGLHHAPDKRAVFRELARVVKPGGIVVVADAEAGTPTAEFLNGFVDAHASMGHEGVFFDAGTREDLERSGLAVVADALLVVPWSFPSRDAMGTFCGTLFGIDRAEPARVAQAIEDTIGTTAGPGHVNMAWALRYFTCQRRNAYKPAAR